MKAEFVSRGVNQSVTYRAQVLLSDGSCVVELGFSVFSALFDGDTYWKTFPCK